MVSLAQTDPFRAIISRIAAYGSAEHPGSRTFQAIRSQDPTLNARRRKQIPLRTIGRTNYCRAMQALQLVRLHRYALIGWPTLLGGREQNH